jgi:hypothetical protein
VLATGSNPVPSSRTMSSTVISVSETSITTRFAWPCLVALVSSPG